MPSPDRRAKPGLRIRVLGPLEVEVEGSPIAVDTRKALAILALLAVERRPFARDELAALLWPESDDDSARGALRRTLSVLRAALDRRWIGVTRSAVDLEIAEDDVDLRVVERAVGSAELRVLQAAAEVARGPLLAGFTLRDSPEFDDWRAARATAVERSVASLFDRLAATAEAGGSLPIAVAAAGRRVDLDPLDEDAHRRLMRLQAASGDRAAAVRQYRACVAILERELGVAPLAETTELYELIRDLRPTAPVLGEMDSPAGSAPGTVVGRPAGLPMVGRSTQIAALRTAVASAAPDGSLVLVAGEAGIGKSRLVEALVDTRPPGSRALVARAYATESGIAYGPVVELLRSGLALPDAKWRIETLGSRARAELERLVAMPRPGPGPDPAAVAPPASDPDGRARLLDAICEALTALTAGTAPGLVVVEDVQWADDSTRVLLAWLARRLTARGLALVLTWRPEDLDDAGAAFADALRAVPAADEIRLGRLDRDAVAALVDAATDAGLPAWPADRLLDESEGLPLFVVEALFEAPPGGNADGGDGKRAAGRAARRSIHALIRDRLASVGETAAQVAAAAAVIGRSFDLQLVRAASGRSEDEAITALEELVRRGVLREMDGGRGPGFDFAHAAFRDAAYEGASLARRRLLHRRIAELLRTDPALRDRPGRLAQVAAHEQAAGRDAEAAEAYREAGLEARNVFAVREAARYLETALALGHPDVAPILVALGELRTAQGDYAGAVTALEGAAAVGDAALLPGIELRLGRVHALRGDPATARSHLDAVIDLLGADDQAQGSGATTLGRALVQRALVAIGERDPVAATDAAKQALAIGERTDDPALAGAADRMLGLVAHQEGDLIAARAHLERSLELAAVDPDPSAAVAAGNALALVEAAAGDRDDAIARLEAALAAAHRIGALHLEAAIENNLADQLHAAGRPDEAMDHLKRAVTLFADIGGHPGELEPEIWKLVTW